MRKQELIFAHPEDTSAKKGGEQVFGDGTLESAAGRIRVSAQPRTRQLSPPAPDDIYVSPSARFAASICTLATP